MLSLSPAKLLVILVIALIVLGPEKLPQVARQLGAAWHDLRGWRSRIESEVRGTFPNLPPTHEVAQAVRSPFAFLDRLADEHERTASQGAEDAAGVDDAGASGPAGASGATGAADGSGTANGSGTAAHGVGSSGQGVVTGNGSAVPGAAPSAPAPPGVLPAVPDDPSMN